ncbi:MAG: hypothetical protein U5R48_18150 [Gammaproteobacteria bacterium]|nr:hypothetical protein [Gammaproteobacteria bacterium]
MAAHVLASHHEGGRAGFIREMNRTAKELGMTATASPAERPVAGQLLDADLVKLAGRPTGTRRSASIPPAVYSGPLPQAGVQPHLRTPIRSRTPAAGRALVQDRLSGRGGTVPRDGHGHRRGAADPVLLDSFVRARRWGMPGASWPLASSP